MGAYMKSPFSSAKSAPPTPLAPAPAGLRVSFAPEVFDGGSPSEALQAQFPQVTFRPLSGRASHAAFAGADALMVRADAAKASEVDAMSIGLREGDHADRAIVLLDNADLDTTRRLVREGVFDVLPTPVSETALVISLERLLKRFENQAPHPRQAGQVVAFLKAGGGVGATTLATQHHLRQPRQEPARLPGRPRCPVGLGGGLPRPRRHRDHAPCGRRR